MSKWSLYDGLISAIPDRLLCTGCNTGFYWTTVVSDEGGIGLALTVPEFSIPLTRKERISGMPLKKLAELSKSWNFIEAAIGVAAISAYYNLPERVKNCGIEHPQIQDGKLNAFDLYQKEAAGCKVAVIGHFPVLEQRFKNICNLTVLERNLRPGDTPDTACEYILEDQDFVFITGSALVNKTMPRLLELSKNAKVILVGPSTILSPLMFEYGVYGLSGFVVRDVERCESLLRESNPFALFDTGEMVDRIQG